MRASRVLRLGADPVDALRVAAGLDADHGTALRAEPVFTAFPQALDPTAPAVLPFRVLGDAPHARLREYDGPPIIYMTPGTLAGR